MTPIAYFLVFGAGIRALLNRANWVSWVTYTAALFLAVGSRHINLILAAWLPATAVLLMLWSFLPFRASRVNKLVNFHRSRSFPASTALTAFLCSLVGLGAAKIVVTTLCHQFGVVERSSLGSAMSCRIATWVDRLSAEKKQNLLFSVERLTNDPLVKLAIQFQIELGSYDNGTGSALSAALRERGFEGEKLLAEKDQLISQSSLCFYRTLDPGLVK